jgi:tripartite-type tricarboxylate transporter receptor subunit TctC
MRSGFAKGMGAALAILTLPELACAQSEPNLAGRTFRVLIGSTVGGTYDILGRLVARHIGRHLPGNPTVVPQNMPGAGGMAAANHLFNVAPKDGSIIGVFNKGVAGAAIAGVTEARFDATRMSWVGTPFTETGVCFAVNAPRVAVKSITDLYERELVTGDLGAGSSSHIYPKALNALLGLKFKQVGGYFGSAAVYLALERGEVDGFCEGIDGIMAKRPDWITKKHISILFQGGAEPNPDLNNVPFIAEQARNDDDRRAIAYLYAAEGLGRPFAAPPDMPPGRLKMVRDAFAAMMKDSDFISDAMRQGFELRPQGGEYLARLVQSMAATPKPIRDKILSLSK